MLIPGFPLYIISYKTSVINVKYEGKLSYMYQTKHCTHLNDRVIYTMVKLIKKVHVSVRLREGRDASIRRAFCRKQSHSLTPSSVVCRGSKKKKSEFAFAPPLIQNTTTLYEEAGGSDLLGGRIFFVPLSLLPRLSISLMKSLSVVHNLLLCCLISVR